jgi:CBS domain-containing protein
MSATDIERRLPHPPGREGPGAAPPAWDGVDEAGDESFPASDPPSFSPVTSISSPSPPGKKTAADLMTPNPLSIRDGATVAEAVAFLTEKGFSAAPVIDEAGRPVGVISRTDILLHERENAFGAGNPGRRPAGRPEVLVRNLMTPALFAVSPEATADQVADQMIALNVHRLFVSDPSGVLVGVITALDLLRHLRS